jgi:chromosomal replication initiator protein
MFWDGVVRQLQAETSPFVVEAWVRPLIAEANGEHIRLLCPSALHRERIRDRFLDRIHQLVAAEAGRPVEIELEIAARNPGAAVATEKTTSVRNARVDSEPAPAPAAQTKPKNAVSVIRSQTRRVRPHEQPDLPYTFENFVVGACNRLAREASLAVAQGTQQPVNPLYLMSAPGLGKTHLARAIARTRKRTDGRVIYTSSESFTNQFTGAIRDKRMDRFKQRFRQNCDVLVVEDVQFLSAKTATQLELFHTMSHLIDIGARVVLTADRLPREIVDLNERLRSHMTAGLVATLDAPDALVRREILRVKAAGGGVHLPGDCLDLLVDSMRGSVRDLEGVLVQLVTTSSLLKRAIDLELTEQALNKISALRTPELRLPLNTIIEVVARFYRTTPEALASRSRRNDVMIPRQLAMYLCHRYTDQPAAAIGRAFARSHPSVSNAEKAVERQVLESAPFRYKVEAISARLDELERKPRSEISRSG